MDLSTLIIPAIFMINFLVVLLLAMETDYYNRVWWPTGYGQPRGRFYISPSILAISLFTSMIPILGVLIALPFWAAAKEQFDEMNPRARDRLIAEGNERAKKEASQEPANG